MKGQVPLRIVHSLQGQMPRVTPAMLCGAAKHKLDKPTLINHTWGVHHAMCLPGSDDDGASASSMSQSMIPKLHNTPAPQKCVDYVINRCGCTLQPSRESQKVTGIKVTIRLSCSTWLNESLSKEVAAQQSTTELIIMSAIYGLLEMLGMCSV